MKSLIVSPTIVVGLAVVLILSCADISKGEELGVNKQVVQAPVSLSAEHIAAINRQRRIYVNNDVSTTPGSFGIDVKQWVDARFSLFDEPGSQVDTISWCMDEGNLAYYPSRVLPVTKCPRMKIWFDAGIDIVQVMVEESHKRGLEAFWEYRLNGADREADLGTPAKLAMKEQHPDWLIEGAWWPPGLWDFAVPEVQDYKVAILREVAENYDFDGIDIDFGRHPPCLPIGHQWEHRDAMTDFIRKVRLMLQEVAEKRGRPFLLSVRVPATVPGCHYDGLDIETWARENLNDIIVMGVRSVDVDVAGFRRTTAGTHIKLYPCIDDHHSTAGYFHPPIEFFRGICANWWRQGVDGILTFNFDNESPSTRVVLGLSPPHPAHQQAYHEMSDPEALRFLDKMFIVQRRFGGGWEGGWDSYQNTNVQAPLPIILPISGEPRIVPLYVADDLAASTERVKRIELRVLMPGVPVETGLEVKLNGVLLPGPISHKDGWWTYTPTPQDFAVGSNLISMRLWPLPTRAERAVTGMEVHVDYND